MTLNPPASLLVKFRFDGNDKFDIALFTYEQYTNIKKLPIIVECKIVKNQKKTLSEQDMKLINKNLTAVFAKLKLHTQTLSEE